ncbi:hypothetical protein B4N89_05390 [Embleya scabrispora]|uniref:Uncharacterized protein n=1 Tax=Embleya scabrispora TaxID=159449 RepID=A0A1T3NUJ0_9ACTN|nr:hypothetical protein [Embleya scabrispora]OPC80456.1 hypothetical protein B4N89_05390 [Embleya scabrispora]
MSTARGRIYLGDLVRAIVALDVTDADTAAEIARMLGIAGDADAPESADGLDEALSADEPAGPPAPGEIVPMPGVPDAGCSLLVLRGPHASNEAIEPAAPGEALPGEVDRLLEAGTDERPGPPEPPWVGRWAPGVMFAVGSTDVVGRSVDERALVRRVAARSFLRELPRRARPTTRQGVQLLLDTGESMMPFRADQRWLRELAAGVVGRDRVEVLRFWGTPARGVRWVGRRERAAYRPPAAGTPVVLISDLGLRRLPFSGDAAAGPVEWGDWIDAVRRAGCPVVCVTPYPARAHPWSLRQRVSLVPLDRRTSIRSARRETRRVRGEVRR